MKHAAPLLTLTAALTATLAACSQPHTNAPWARPYPERPTIGPTADIQVIRDATHITMTNTTARSFGPSMLWLNMQWSLPIDGLKPGQTLTLNLEDFRNEYNETFRAGGFFATERPDTIALAQIETDAPEQTPPPATGAKEMVGLVTIRGTAE